MENREEGLEIPNDDKLQKFNEWLSKMTGEHWMFARKIEQNYAAFTPWVSDLFGFLTIAEIAYLYLPELTHPFRLVIDYDPEQVRFLVRVYGAGAFID